MKLINRIFVALMVVLSVFALQSCGGNQQNGSSQEEVSDDKPSLQEIVDEFGIQLPVDMGEGLTVSEIDCVDDALRLHIYIPSTVTIEQFEQDMPFDVYFAELKKSYASGVDEQQVEKMTRKAIDNDYDLIFVFDNTEDSVEYTCLASEIKK